MFRTTHIRRNVDRGSSTGGGRASDQCRCHLRGPSAPSSLLLYFDRGSATVRPKDTALLDQASRLYREGKPIVMIVSGSTDSTGSAAVNLQLSQRRANNVLQGLVSRSIPIERFQVVAKGETDPAVPTPPGVSEERNRCVEIAWR